MKTRKQKVISRILCMVVSILLLASFFVVPVSAADLLSNVVISNIMYDYGGDSHDSDQLPYESLNVFYMPYDLLFTSYNNTTSSNASSLNPLYIDNTRNQYMEFTFADVDPNNYHFGVYYINQLFDDGVNRTFAKGDTLFIDGGFFGCWTFDDARLTQFRFTLRELGDSGTFSYGRVVASTDVINFNITEDSEGFDYDHLAFNFSQDITSPDLCLCFEFKADLPDTDFIVGFESTEFIIQFGDGVSPNYPIYPSAPGGDDIAGLGSAEQELLDSSAAGLDEGVFIIGNIGNLINGSRAGIDLVAFLGAFNGMMDRLFVIPGVNPLVYISLSLGLFGSLFGLAGSIISAASRGSGQAKREAERESRKK